MDKFSYEGFKIFKAALINIFIETKDHWGHYAHLEVFDFAVKCKK